MVRAFTNTKWGAAIWSAIDWLGNKTAIPEKWSIHMFSVQWGWGPSWKNIRFYLGPRNDPPSLFMNGIIFFQIRFPFWIGLMVRWCGSCSPSYWQGGLGWKGNGRFAILFRLQTDASAAKGMDFPNVGQSNGWEFGSK